MEDSDLTSRSTDSIIEEIRKLLEEFNQKLAEGTKDPDHFLKMSEIEAMLSGLCESTENLYLRDTIAALASVDERRLIASKKENTSPKESD